MPGGCGRVKCSGLHGHLSEGFPEAHFNLSDVRILCPAEHKTNIKLLLIVCWCLVSWLANVTVMFIKRDSKAEHWGWQLNRSDPVRTKNKLQTRIKGQTGSNDGNENENAGSRQTHKHRLKSTGSDSLLRHRCTQRKESSQVTKLCSLFFNLMTWLIARSCELIAECPAFLCPSNKWQNALWWF